MWYSIYFFRLILLLLPDFLRNPVLIHFVDAIINPVTQLHDQWQANRRANIQKLSYNSQVCYLRKALNDYYDFEQRRIVIENTLEIQQDFLFTIPENEVVFLGTMYLEQDFNYVNGQIDFIVKVPAEIMIGQSNEVNATIEFYHLAGMSYKIIEI